METDRPDHALDLERAVIGAALEDATSLMEAVDVLRPEDFYVEAHRTIFQYMVWFAEEGKPVDEPLLNQAMKEAGIGTAVTGLVYELACEAQNISNTRHWALKVKDLAIRREVVKLAREVISKSSSMSASDLIDLLSSRVIDVSHANVPTRLMTIGEAAASVVRDALEMADGRTSGAVVKTGIEAIDNSVFMRKGQLVVLAATASVGKSSLALQIADNVAKSKCNVVYFSPEMTSKDLAARELSERTGFYVTAIQRGSTLDHLARERLTKAGLDLTDLSLLVDDSPGMTTADIQGRARQKQLQGGLDLVIVDYLQLVRSSSTRNRNREQEVAEISRNLKLAARYLDVPIIVCSQLSRKHLDEKREPHLHDLRESGAIENDADTVIMLYRPNLQDAKTMIFVRKQRQGPLASFAAMFDPIRLRFNNVVRGDGI